MHLEENFFSTLGYMEYGTSKLYVYLFHIFPKMHLYYDNSQDKRENRNSKMEELFPDSLHTVQRLTRRWRSKRSCAVRSNPVDILSLTLPYLQSNFTVGGRPERLAINCLGLFEDIIRHYSLLPHRLSSKILGIIFSKSLVWSDHLEIGSEAMIPKLKKESRCFKIHLYICLI